MVKSDIFLNLSRSTVSKQKQGKLEVFNRGAEQREQHLRLYRATGRGDDKPRKGLSKLRVLDRYFAHV